MTCEHLSINKIQIEIEQDIRTDFARRIVTPGFLLMESFFLEHSCGSHLERFDEES